MIIITSNEGTPHGTEGTLKFLCTILDQMVKFVNNNAGKIYNVLLEDC